MTHENEINKQIQNRYDELRNTMYDGPKLPKGIIDKFRVGIMSLPYSNHKFNMVRVREIIEKEEFQLNWLEVGMVINFIHEIPPEKIFFTLEECIEFMINLSNIVINYNTVTSKWQNEIEGLKNRLKNTSGIIRASSLPSGGGKLISK